MIRDDIHPAARRAFRLAKKANPGYVCLFRMANVYTALLDDVTLVAGALGIVVLADTQMLSLSSAHLRTNIARIEQAGFAVKIIEGVQGEAIL